MNKLGIWALASIIFVSSITIFAFAQDEPTSSTSPPVEKKLIVIRDDRLRNGFHSYTVIVDGQIRLDPKAGHSGASISADDKTATGKLWHNHQNRFLFTGSIVSITSDAHLITTVDGIEVPNNSPPAIVLAPGEKELLIRGGTDSVKKKITFEIIVTGQIKLGDRATGNRDKISPDGTRLNGDMYRGMFDGFIFSGEIVSITADSSIIPKVDGVRVPYTDTSLLPTELPNKEKVQEKVNEVSEQEVEVSKQVIEEVQETVNQVHGNGTSSGGLREKELVVSGKDVLLAIDINYIITVDGQIRLGPLANPPTEIVSADGKTVTGFVGRKSSFDSFLFTGNLISITANGHLVSTVDGIKVPNNTPPATVIQANERKLHIRGDPAAPELINFQIKVTGQIKVGYGGTRGQDIVSRDGTTVNGNIFPGNFDGFIFSGDIVSITADSSIIPTVNGVRVPYTDTSLLLTELPNTEAQEKVSKVSEQVSEEVQETVNRVQGNGTSSGGCLIATATFGTELAPQVQQLRELRDNSLLKTTSGSAFMIGFNHLYYSFSPIIADFERENPAFKEVVKISIMPLLMSLSILNFVDIDSDEKMLGYGISIILLNLGIYFVMPAVIIERTIRYYKSKK